MNQETTGREPFKSDRNSLPGPTVSDKGQIIDTEFLRFTHETQQQSHTHKIRDIVIGFFGWVFFHNAWFLVGFGTSFSKSVVGGVIFAMLPFLIGMLVVILTKKIWIGVGSATAILTSTLIWISYGLPALFFLLPFPLGMAL